MKPLLFLKVTIAVLVAMVVPAADADAAAAKALRLRDGAVVHFSEMVNDMRKADIIFVGELHNRPADHVRELWVLESLHADDVPMAVGLEMFRTDGQKHLDDWVAGRTSPDQFIPRYYENWDMAWPLYSAIFQFAREHQIPMVGLNIAERIVQKIARSGFASLTTDEKKDLPPGISCNVDPKYMEFIRRAYASHQANGKLFGYFCEAQMVWDKAMASHIVSYLGRNAGRKIVVLTGVGHAMKQGIAEQVAELGKFSSLVILPSVPREMDRNTVTLRDADYLLLD